MKPRPALRPSHPRGWSKPCWWAWRVSPLMGSTSAAVHCGFHGAHKAVGRDLPDEPFGLLLHQLAVAPLDPDLAADADVDTEHGRVRHRDAECRDAILARLI
jgi:hypothetical protein